MSRSDPSTGWRQSDVRVLRRRLRASDTEGHPASQPQRWTGKCAFVRRNYDAPHAGMTGRGLRCGAGDDGGCDGGVLRVSVSRMSMFRTGNLPQPHEEQKPAKGQPHDLPQQHTRRCLLHVQRSATLRYPVAGEKPALRRKLGKGKNAPKLQRGARGKPVPSREQQPKQSHPAFPAVWRTGRKFALGPDPDRCPRRMRLPIRRRGASALPSLMSPRPVCVPAPRAVAIRSERFRPRPLSLGRSVSPCLLL